MVPRDPIIYLSHLFFLPQVSTFSQAFCSQIFPQALRLLQTQQSLAMLEWPVPTCAYGTVLMGRRVGCPEACALQHILEAGCPHNRASWEENII